MKRDQEWDELQRKTAGAHAEYQVILPSCAALRGVCPCRGRAARSCASNACRGLKLGRVQGVAVACWIAATPSQPGDLQDDLRAELDLSCQLPARGAEVPARLVIGTLDSNTGAS